MGSTTGQRYITGLSCVAIVLLVGLIVTVWVLLGQGAFRAAPRALPQSRARHKEYIEKSHLDDLKTDIEFVKPLKMDPLPLHEHDIMFDQIYNNHDKPLLRHNSGHFRHKQAEVWDPHPRYVIRAFGRELQLELHYNDRFISPNLHITRVWDNHTHRFRHDSRSSGCYYTGAIIGDVDSDVAVSLCNGMTGYIRTSEDNYYIEPAVKASGGDLMASFLHRITKIPHQETTTNHNEVLLNTSESEQCETNENHIIEDNFANEVVIALPTQAHHLHKRQIIDDDVTIGRRPVRDVGWPPLADTEKSSEYFVKVLVVVDKSMMLYHQSEEELRHYVLVLMSHAALLYKDASIGNSIALSVVNIWMLDDTVFTSNNSQVMLRKFCEWQERHAVDRQHDCSILLTRDPICRQNSSTHCDTLGVAEVSSMCNPKTSCAIVREKGLSTSYTIAHELGHVLNMPHDETAGCKPFNLGPKFENIMARSQTNGTKAWLWSECSRYYVTEFLITNPSARCLIRPPTTDYISPRYPQSLPGEDFEVDKQCELEFGLGFRRCPDSNLPDCAHLWCTTDYSYGCRSTLQPWADGTRCRNITNPNPSQWCHYGECIPEDRALFTPISGGWGPWGPWGQCSRSCGGGIQKATRQCNSPIPQYGGTYCTGRSIQYLSCNTHECPSQQPEFRVEQCSQFNGNTMKVPDLPKDVEWVPKYGVRREDLCKLTCRPKHTNSPYNLKDKVVDGTKCGLYSYDICVNGVCVAGGCDNQLNSKIVLDECGVCGGDNSKCEEIRGSYNISSAGYKRVLRIPRGSSNVDIQQNAPRDSNYLVLMDGETGDFVLNSKKVIAPHAKNVIYAGVNISYSGCNAPIEQITTSKNHKLTKDLVLGLLSIGNAPAPFITYRYIINRENAPRYTNYKRYYRTFEQRYGWRLYQKQWSECNSICSGIQYIHPICVELSMGKRQPDSFCSDSEKQTQKQECNTHCRLQWTVRSRGPCSANCGQGQRTINHDCFKMSETNDFSPQIVDKKHCAVLGKPPISEVCEGPCESTHWEYSPWSECSTSCGGGNQLRSAKCVDHTSELVDEFHCSLGDKITQQSCNNHKCPVWVSGDWTPCSVTCGRGFRTKPVFCHVDGRIYEPIACHSQSPLPIEKEECYERPCGIWSVDQWGSCSAPCGAGLQTRGVVCKSPDQQELLDDFCAGILKPNSTKDCYGECTPTFRWITGTWGECSRSCNLGTRSRRVVCRNEFGDQSEHYCAHIPRPISMTQCNSHQCPVWNYGGWSECDSNCEKHRQVTCQDSSAQFVHDSQCEASTMPEKHTKCRLVQCNGRVSSTYFGKEEKSRYRWKMGKWGICSTSCGSGLRQRHVECEDALNRVTLVDHYCQHLKRPKASRKCERYACPYVWLEGPWTQCSTDCGKGTRRRDVSCHRVHPKAMVDPRGLTRFGAEFCDVYSRPKESETCAANQCGEVFVWRAGPWTQCSHSCGKKGHQIRSLSCIYLRTGQKVQKHRCRKELRPIRRMKCNQWRCMYGSCKDVQRFTNSKENKDYVMAIGNRSASVYCYKMDTDEPEEYISLDGDNTNFAENYHKRLKDLNQCPHNGQRTETCDCLEIGPERSGLSRFWKVRLNVTSMRIIGDDFTFSRQEHGMKVPFGTAGDCYSTSEGCSQGRFSIDLTATSFKLADSVRWRNIGKYATSQIQRSERRVLGKCGGYCGNCLADLHVDVT